MRTLLKSAVARGYAAAGGLRRLHAGKLVVLTFHRVRPDGEATDRPMRTLDVDASDFRRLLSWMGRRYEPLALRDWIDRGAPPPRASFAVTFDDGWADNFEHAFPVLRELGVPATIFLATGAVEDRRPFWWQSPGLSDAEIERRKTAAPASAGVPAGGAETSAADFLTWDQVRELGRSGLVAFGPHGHRHALLTDLARAEAVEDVRRCWELMKIRAPAALAPVLAWPNGNARSDLAADLEALGLRAAVGIRRGAPAAPSESRWDLPRNNVDRNLSREPGLWPWLLLRAR